MFFIQAVSLCVQTDFVIVWNLSSRLSHPNSKFCGIKESTLFHFDSQPCEGSNLFHYWGFSWYPATQPSSWISKSRGLWLNPVRPKLKPESVQHVVIAMELGGFVMNRLELLLSQIMTGNRCKWSQKTGLLFIKKRLKPTWRPDCTEIQLSFSGPHLRS